MPKSQKSDFPARYLDENGMNGPDGPCIVLTHALPLGDTIILFNFFLSFSFFSFLMEGSPWTIRLSLWIKTDRSILEVNRLYQLELRYKWTPLPSALSSLSHLS
jgi:hypothetical protein